VQVIGANKKNEILGMEAKAKNTTNLLRKEDEHLTLCRIPTLMSTVARSSLIRTLMSAVARISLVNWANLCFRS
jgi:hypothetical protein